MGVKSSLIYERSHQAVKRIQKSRAKYYVLRLKKYSTEKWGNMGTITEPNQGQTHREVGYTYAKIVVMPPMNLSLTELWRRCNV